MHSRTIHFFTLGFSALTLAVLAQSPVLTEGFKRADRNGDGELSADEMNQFAIVLAVSSTISISQAQSPSLVTPPARAPRVEFRTFES